MNSKICPSNIGCKREPKDNLPRLNISISDQFF